MRFSFVAVALMIVAVMQQPAIAEQPTLTRLYPPGGQRGTTVEVTAQGKFPNPELRLWANHVGLTTQSIQPDGKFSLTIDSSVPPGIYFVRIVDAVGATPVHRFVVGTLPEMVETEPNNQPIDVIDPITPPTIANGALQDRGDVDLFPVLLQPGETLIASLEANRGLQSPIDAVMQIIDGEGHVLASNHDYHDLDPLIRYQATEEGIVQVRVFAFPSAPDSSISLTGAANHLYRLTLTKNAFLETTLPLVVQKGAMTSLQPFGWNIDTTLPPLQVNPTDQQQSVPVFFDGMAGHVELPVVDFPLHNESQDENAQTADLSLPVCVTGRLAQAKEQDLYRFSAEKDSVWKFSLASRSLGYPLDAVLQIEDEAGKVLQRLDDVGQERDPLLRWTAPSTGAFVVRIFDLHGWGDPLAFYRLTIAQPQPQFVLQSSSDLSTGKVGTELEFTVRVDRQDGFDKPIRVSFVELPESCRAESVLSEPTGDTAKEVKLKLIADQPLNQPLRIQGTSEGDVAVTKLVTADNGLTDLWFVIEPTEAPAAQP